MSNQPTIEKSLQETPEVTEQTTQINQITQTIDPALVLKGLYKNGSNVYGLSLLFEKFENTTRAQLQMFTGASLHSVYQYTLKDGILQEEQYAYNNLDAKNLYSLVDSALRKTKSNKGKYAVVCPYGTATGVSVSNKAGDNFEVALFNKLPLMVYVDIKKTGENLSLTDINYESKDSFVFQPFWVGEEHFTKLSIEKKVKKNDESFLTDVEYKPTMRTLAEISLFKDVRWLNQKSYYIVQNDEYVLDFLDKLRNYSGMVVLDYETSGLYINAFGKKHSNYSEIIKNWNNDPTKEYKFKVDYVVGVIFCIQPNVSYYFPLANREFANVFSERGTEARRKAIDWILAQYTLVYQGRQDTDMYRYWQRVKSGEVAYDDVEPDDIFMELSRPILERGVVPWGGKFEYKCGLLYDIDTVLTDDGMTLHQLLFKFRSTRKNSGESSALKFQTEKEFGVSTIELSDVFVDYKDDDDSTVKLNPKAVGIDFSYMSYEMTWAYAPADGDFTFQLVKRYRKYMEENKPELLYLYGVELLVTCALGYSEFYGITIMEDEIERTRKIFEIRNIIIEGFIRQSYSLNISSEESERIIRIKTDLDEALKGNSSLDAVYEEAQELLLIYEEDVNRVNLGSPKQVAALLFPNGESTSVAEKVLKQFKKKVDDEGKLLYPLIKPYQEWKSNSTLLTKFFDKLQDFMYPGGHIFASFGQISTATGRMSCKTPNLQQLPSEIKAIMHARKDCVYNDVDYSQIELRVMGALANVYTMLPLYEDEDADIHTLIAHRMYEVPYESVSEDLRSDAKKFNFGIPYQMGLASLAILLFGVPTEENKKKAEEKRRAYFNAQPNLEAYFNDIKQHVKAYGYTKTAWGRERLYSFTDADGKFSKKHQAMAMRQSVNAVIQGTAADIFKIGISRIFYWIRVNRLFEKVYLPNFIHDEVIAEINVKKINLNQAVLNVVHAMQFKVDGFPSLYVGGGVDTTWGNAKGKKNEIHQSSLRRIEYYESQRTGNLLEVDPIFDSVEKAVDRYKGLNYNFRKDKIKSYLENPENFNKKMHPVIPAFLRMEFNTKEVKEHLKNLKESSIEMMALQEKLEYEKEQLEEAKNSNSDTTKIEHSIKIIEDGLSNLENQLEFTALLNEFIKNYCNPELGLSASMFIDSVKLEEIEEAVHYTDGDEENDDMDDDDFFVSGENFEIINDEQLFGTTIEEWIRTFTLVASPSLRLLGIDYKVLSKNQQEQLLEFVNENACEKDDPGALEVVLLLNHNVLKHSGFYIKSTGVSGFIRNSMNMTV